MGDSKKSSGFIWREGQFWVQLPQSWLHPSLIGFQLLTYLQFIWVTPGTGMGASLAAGGQLVIAAFDDNGATLRTRRRPPFGGRGTKIRWKVPRGDLHPLGGTVRSSPSRSHRRIFSSSSRRVTGLPQGRLGVKTRLSGAMHTCLAFGCPGQNVHLLTAILVEWGAYCDMPGSTPLNYTGSGRGCQPLETWRRPE